MSAQLQPTSTPLNDAMAEVKGQMLSSLPKPDLAIIGAAATRMAQSGLAEGAIKVGDKAPDFTLADAAGNAVNLYTALSGGPVVLTVLRGGWCPFCSMEVKALSDALGDINALGASMLAISLQTTEASKASHDKWDSGFPLLVDAGAKVIDSYRLGFMVDESLIPVYDALGIDLGSANGDLGNYLPIPATYVIDRDGTVAAAYISTDYTTRMEPRAILDALKGLRG
jgi:peroxiredoxin